MSEPHYKVGYTQGVYDMFHIGHLNLLNNAKKYCDYLIVGVNTDRLVKSYKNKSPVINERDRLAIISNIKVVNECQLVNTLDKTEIYNTHPFDVIFIGSDWKGSSRWEQTEKDMAKLGVAFIYLPYTQGISSTGLRLDKDERIEES
ncbi:MAG: adenylyltransferase/cytidyltransferase family protein [Selenomonadaceae bacterium]|nr:adenylyltransferase/cytidyltransferase family protein [Selenomonadaceae bacterium]